MGDIGMATVPEGYMNRCPCGDKPSELVFVEGPSCKYGFIQGNCCGDWLVEFPTEYNEPGPELDRLMVQAWNHAKRED